MKIAVNTRFLLKDKLEGIGRFTYETCRRMVQQHPDVEFIFIFDRKYDPQFIFGPNVTPVVIPPPARHPLLWRIWFGWSVPRVLKKYKPDVFLSPDGYLCLSAKIPQIPVMHDLAFEHRPGDISKSVLNYYKHFFPLFAKKAARIATVSEFSKQDIVKTYGINAGKIDAVYNGASDVFKPISEEEKAGIKNRFTGGNPYFIYVGALQPRKNIVTLLRAFNQFKTNTNRPEKLLIVGRKAWQTEEMDAAYTAMRHRDDVIFTGRLSDDDLAKTMAAARALVYVPFFEGFGLPLVEAFKCHVPVITSNVSSLPEVAGGAGITIDPENLENISTALADMAANDILHKELTEKAKLRSGEYTWEKTTGLLWNCITKALEN